MVRFTARDDGLRGWRSGREISIKSLVERIAELIGFEGEIAWDATNDGQPRRWLNTQRARESFGLEARIRFEGGVKRAIDWHLAHRDTL